MKNVELNKFTYEDKFTLPTKLQNTYEKIVTTNLPSSENNNQRLSELSSKDFFEYEFSNVKNEIPIKKQIENIFKYEKFKSKLTVDNIINSNPYARKIKEYYDYKLQFI
jgi:hypothetical protein